MADFSYTPKFHHFAWVDNVDRCEAGGTNGFNIRFETIESDLQGVSTVVAQIGTELDLLNARVPTVPHTVTVPFAPTLLPAGGSAAWALQTSGNAVAPANGAPQGVLPLTLPDHVTITSLRVCGHGIPPSGQNTATILSRVSVTDGTTRTVVAFDTSTVPLNTARVLDPSALNLVDLTNYRYVIQANSGVGSASDPVTLVSFQITYTNP
ncbi:hypothetical protein ACFZDK_40185 [Streptomyces sp. NPDC007901]|uniref:hypothetical protein n=1 Tax=Streptomyces sp. NPDC007901 TaxID=3364785 RepID=UPI0036EDB6EE